MRAQFELVADCPACRVEAVVVEVYDPNEPGQPLTLVFDRATGRFTLPATPYFVGGRVDVYEVYRSWLY